MRRAVLVLLLAALAAGCGSQHPVTTSPESASALADRTAEAAGRRDALTPRSARDARYPLAAGNWWHYQTLVRHYDMSSGGGQPFDEEAGTLTIEQVCRGPALGRFYWAERYTGTTPSYNWSEWLFLRQERSALYEADQFYRSSMCETGASPEPAAARPVPDAARERIASRYADPVKREAMLRAWDGLAERIAALRAVGALGTPTALRGAAPAWPGPSTPPPGELMRLRYPLRPGQRWMIRESPRFNAIVEQPVTYATRSGPASGWRIRYTSELFGPADRVYVVYGGDGYLGLQARLYGEATDENGNPIGTLVWEQLNWIEDFELVGTGSPLADGQPSK